MFSHKRYAIYARVASAGFDSQEHIQEQIRLAHEFLASTGCDAAERIYTDCGVSGATIHRPGLEALLSDAAKGEFHAVVCASEDRLGSGESFELIRDELIGLGVDFTPADRASAFLHHAMMQDLLLR